MQGTVPAGLILLIMSLQPATSQSAPNPAQAAKQMAPGDIASAAKSAAQTLTSNAKDKLLVKDLLGAPVHGPNGSAIGTVEDLVVLPGGRVVAAIVSTKSKSTGRIPVPFAVVKLSRTSGKLELNLPVQVSELTGMKEVQELKSAIPGM